MYLSAAFSVCISLIIIVSCMSHVERNNEECKFCTAELDKIFIKIVHQLRLRAEYVCRECAVLDSKFGIIVDRACSPDGCENIDKRPIMRTFTNRELACLDSQLSSNGLHIKIGTLVKDYMEIVSIGTVLTYFVSWVWSFESLVSLCDK